MTVSFVVDYQLSAFQMIPCSTNICYRCWSELDPVL